MCSSRADRVRVYARVRPAGAKEGGQAAVGAAKDGRTLRFLGERPALMRDSVDSAISGSGGAISRSAAGREFTFDGVFGEGATQADVFKELGAPLLQDVLNGYDACALAYGQTGAGKTFSLLNSGEGDREGASTGLLPRLAAGLFVGVDCDPRHVYSVEVSMCQVYCEQVDDLLKPKSTNLKLVQRSDRDKAGWEVKGLTWFECSSPEFLLSVIRNGQRRIVYAETQLNKHSSRAHAVIQLRVTRRRRMASVAEGADLHASLEREEGSGRRAVRATVGRLTVVDLAGSERVKRSLAEGARMREAQNINTSLFNIGCVVNALATRAAHVPFRDSVLTRLLEGQLRGNCNTRMLVCVSPTAVNAGESLGTAEFAARAMRIETAAVQNETEVFVDARDLVGDLAVGMRDSAIAASSAEIVALEARLAEEEGRRQGAQGRLEAESAALAEAREVAMSAEHAAAVAAEDAARARSAEAEAERRACNAEAAAAAATAEAAAATAEALAAREEARAAAEERAHAAEEAQTAEAVAREAFDESQAARVARDAGIAAAEADTAAANADAANAHLEAEGLREELRAAKEALMLEKARSSSLEAALVASSTAAATAAAQLEVAREEAADRGLAVDAMRETLQAAHAAAERALEVERGRVDEAEGRANEAEATAAELAREAEAAHDDLRDAAAELAATAAALAAARHRSNCALADAKALEIALEQAYDAAGEAEADTVDALRVQLDAARAHVARLEALSSREEEAYSAARARITTLVRALSREGAEYRSQASGAAARARASLEGTRGRVRELEVSAEAEAEAFRADVAAWRRAAGAAARSGLLCTKHCRDGRTRARVVRVVGGGVVGRGRIEWASVGPFRRGVDLGAEATVLPTGDAPGDGAALRLSTAARLLELDFEDAAAAAAAHAALEALGVENLAKPDDSSSGENINGAEHVKATTAMVACA